MDDAQLERWLYPGHSGRPKTRPEPDWAQVHQELRSRRHVTLQLLWQEYRQVHPDGSASACQILGCCGFSARKK